MTYENIFDLLVKHTREVVPELSAHAFTPTDRLKELGANSIDRSEIIICTLDALQLRVPLTELAGATNIGELAELIHAKARA
jgi:polyketide biosynthesis acyl carrier protein